MNTNEFGMIAWGVITAVLALAALAAVIAGGLHLVPNNLFVKDTPLWIAGLYLALIDCGTVVAGVLGFSGLAGSNFYKASAGIKGKSE